MRLFSHIKQAWRILLANKLFSMIYILGTALAIATTTMFALIYYIKAAPIYPENHRMNTFYLNNVENGYKGDERRNINNPSYSLYRDHLSKVKNATIVSASRWSWDDYVQVPGEDREIEVTVRPTDTNYFRLYEYDFIDGRPFSKEEYDAGILSAVITDRLAMDLFGQTDGIIGQTVSVNYDEFRICGVVREGSQLLSNSYAQVIIPMTSLEDDYIAPCPFVGSVYVTFVSDNRAALKEEIDEIARRFNNSGNEYEVGFLDQPISHILKMLNPRLGQETVSVEAVVKKNLLVLLVLLLVPALNLSGLISSRMDMRSSEIGIRRAFGGTKWALLKQVLYENLLQTLLGGVIGLLIVWSCLMASSGTLLTVLDSYVNDDFASINLTPEILYAPAIFLFAFTVCVILNLLSALLPAWISLRKPVVDNLG